jgi:hypothetical protein
MIKLNEAFFFEIYFEKKKGHLYTYRVKEEEQLKFPSPYLQYPASKGPDEQS